MRGKMTECWLAETEDIFSQSRGHFWLSRWHDYLMQIDYKLLGNEALLPMNLFATMLSLFVEADESWIEEPKHGSENKNTKRSTVHWRHWKGFIARTSCANAIPSKILPFMWQKVIADALGQLRINFTCIFKVFPKLALSRSTYWDLNSCLSSLMTNLKTHNPLRLYAPIKSKLQHPPPPRANPGHLTISCARGVGNLTFTWVGWGKLNQRCQASGDFLFRAPKSLIATTTFGRDGRV